MMASRERPFRRMSEPGSPQLGLAPFARPMMASSPMASVLRIRGIPLNATAESIASFFAGMLPAINTQFQLCSAKFSSVHFHWKD